MTHARLDTPKHSKPMLVDADGNRMAKRAGMWVPYHVALVNGDVSRTPFDTGLLLKALLARFARGC